MRVSPAGEDGLHAGRPAGDLSGVSPEMIVLRYFRIRNFYCRTTEHFIGVGSRVDQKLVKGISELTLCSIFTLDAEAVQLACGVVRV